ncbi:hypothetical protein A4A49_22497 [Nicotiana attenuata]|uniref:Uncharacterized protein n=2 Tax=Nicotiana attenuata TaxID=49451 RepID=A0A1J6KAU9_NICAT|nr:hypothetical protein A4A49_22497 [Nicotiana attenuata]
MESFTVVQSPAKDFFVRNLGFVTYLTVQRDIFLLENQIPIMVIKMLKYGDENLQKELFGRFCRSVVFRDQPTKSTANIDGKNHEDDQPLHLLEILRDVIVSGPLLQPETHHHLRLSTKDLEINEQLAKDRRDVGDCGE